MKLANFLMFDQHEPEQAIRLRRFLVGVVVHLMNFSFVLGCWWLGFLNAQCVEIYAVLAIAFNLIIYLTIRSGLNTRFEDPSLTFLQILTPCMLGLFLMYFAGPARGAFLLLGLAMFCFGMFRFRSRDFIYLVILILTAYAAMIALLARNQADTINLKLELLQWVVFAMTLAQFSFLAGMIGNLRLKVREKNQALNKKNDELEVAFRRITEQKAELEAAFQRISDMAIRDELTGAYNRRCLMGKIVEEAHRSMRNGSAFCICMIDIDFFKSVNDVYGHLAGDDVLRRVADAASRSLRKADFFGRFGGEEFIMLLTDTPLQGATTTAERVREMVASLIFPEINQALHVTVSIGVAEHFRLSDPTVTIKRADDALYRAKESGRNRTAQAPLDIE